MFDERHRRREVLVALAGKAHDHVRAEAEARHRRHQPLDQPAGAIASRSRALRALAGAKNLAFRRRMVGTVQDVLVLQARHRATGDLVGLTGNYVEVAFAGEDALMRTMTGVRVTAADASGTRGEARTR